jgi:dipeptidyl aminopeptidase/acylaminoacyl peptidase
VLGELSVKNWPDRQKALYLRPPLGVCNSDDPELYNRASPRTNACADDPPYLLFHSLDDLVVPAELARNFTARLKQAGVPVTPVQEEGLE